MDQTLRFDEIEAATPEVLEEVSKLPDSSTLFGKAILTEEGPEVQKASLLELQQSADLPIYLSALAIVSQSQHPELRSFALQELVMYHPEAQNQEKLPAMLSKKYNMDPDDTVYETAGKVRESMGW